MDSHCHFAKPEQAGEITTLIDRARARGIGNWIQGGIDPDDWRRQRELARSQTGIIPTYGLHPWWVASHTEEECNSALTTLIEHLPEARGLGELGLDYSKKIDPSSYSRQRECFQRQIELSIREGLPLILHIVSAHTDAYEALARASSQAATHSLEGQWSGGLVHGFTAGREIAASYARLGLLLSIGGAILRPGYRELKDSVTGIPDDALCIESESPGMPEDPLRLFEIAQAVAHLRGVEPEAILSQSRANLERIFGSKRPTHGNTDT